MYVAVKGGEKAIEHAHGLLAEERRGDELVPELAIAQIQNQMGLAVDRVMNEGALYDSRLAAIAIKQAQGDLPEAAFLLRAYRTTLPRLGFSLPMETSSMDVRRRISATFKDLPGGQMLGPTYDYTHRLLDFSLERSRKRGRQRAALRRRRGKTGALRPFHGLPRFWPPRASSIPRIPATGMRHRVISPASP